MTKNEKDLLLKDLCARVPYGVWIEAKLKDCPFSAKCMLNPRNAGDITLIEIGQYDFYKPYLFPLSSMTEEQYWEMQKQSGEDCLEHMEILKNFRNNTDFSNLPLYEYRTIDWFDQNHFDYRGLIPMGLAIDATGKNIY